MKKRLSIIGKGTVGCLSAAHFLRWTDWDIDWVYDPNIPTASVGEGTTVFLPTVLNDSLNWDHHDLMSIGGTVKQGIYKQDWGTENKNFFHPFNLNDIGVHFDATKLQDKIYDQLKDNPRINFVEKNAKPEDLDSDYVMVCSGTPDEYTERYDCNDEDMVVNSAYVTQCYWDAPTFTHTLTIARPYGWVFGIPLQNRCSIGYLYNKDITTQKEVEEDVRNVFEQFNLIPSDTRRNLVFDNYSRRNNYSDRVVYNGNASFFLEPLEATSTSFADQVNKHAWDIWHGNKTAQQCQNEYDKIMRDVGSMIMLHYFADSPFDTVFWEFARENAEHRMREEFKNQTEFSKMIRAAANDEPLHSEIGLWQYSSYVKNITGLGINSKINRFWVESTNK